MKRVVSILLLLALALSLCACGPDAPAESGTPSALPAPVLTADGLARAAVTASGRDPDGLEKLNDMLEPGALEEYIANYYGIPAWEDCAVYRTGGAEVFEVAVLELTDAVSDSDAAAGLEGYIHEREGDFAGYSPAQADIAAHALSAVRERDGRRFAALLLCEEPEAARDAFFDFTGASVPAPPTAAEPSSTPSQPSAPPAPADTPAASSPAGPVTYPGRTPFTDPNIDDMTVYDTSAILAAWEKGDPSGLSDYDKAIYHAAEAVIDSQIEPDMTDLEKEYALYLWVITHMKYDYDHQDPTATVSRDSFTPYGGLIKGKGVCLGFASVFQLLMDMADAECITVVGAAYHSEEDHAWNMVRLDGEWYCVDATWDWTYYNDMGYMRYFNVTSDFMAEEHQWDYANVPEADAESPWTPPRNPDFNFFWPW